ncbi:MAG: putative membrane protein/mono/diheme cytochrome c family protein, partial [Cyclobacteriaceae bacterium]
MNENAWSWVLQLLGRLHPLVVHFPIGLLVVALFMEMLTLNGKRPGLREGINWMVYIGALSAILSASLGWFLKTFDDYSGELIEWHQNLGIATAIFSVVTAYILYKSSKLVAYRASLVISVVLLTITGHLGANLTHGEDFLTDVLPGSKDDYDDGKSLMLLASLKKVDSLSETQQDKLNLEVRAIFAHNCYQCHSENKQKGELVLENKRGVFQGGENGPVIVAGKPEESEIYRRITLSPNDDKVMPKKGKVLKNNEIALIKLWIEKGAHWSDRALKVFPEAALALSKPSLPESSSEQHPVDKLMDVYFDKNDIDWPESVDDKTFIRRVYLDIIGLLPEPDQISQFEEDANKNKRAELIDDLLDDDHNYTQHWLSFWNDLLRNDYSGTGF